ncbi:hypothetical protein D3C80_1715910 [compost metagenome]
MGDGVHTGPWYRDADADTGEALLVAIDRVFGRKGSLQACDIGIQFIAAVAHCRDGGFGQEPEHFRWPVVGEHQGQGIVIDARFRQQSAHVGRCTRCTRDPRTGGA